MKQDIIDLVAKKYKTVRCPLCGRNYRIELNRVYKNDFNEDTWEYLCQYCDYIFELEKEDKVYKEGSSGEEEWKDLTEEMKYMIGIDV